MNCDFNFPICSLTRLVQKVEFICEFTGSLSQVDAVSGLLQ